MTTRRTFFAAIGAAVAGAKAKVWKPVQSRPTLTINRNPQFLTSTLNGMRNWPNKIGDTITIRRPPRFRADGYDNWRDSGSRCKEFGLEPGEMLHLMRGRFRSANEITKAFDAQLRADFEFICGPVPVKAFTEPTGDIPLANARECEEYDD